MKEILLFYLSDCPYCHYAQRALKELVKEDPSYSRVHVDWVEESRHPEIADQYDYYYVPTVFYNGEKLYEAHPSEKYEDCKRNMRAALDKVLAR